MNKKHIRQARALERRERDVEKYQKILAHEPDNAAINRKYRIALNDCAALRRDLEGTTEWK